MTSAHEPPELPPIVARASGFWVNFTLACFLDEQEHVLLDELGVFAGHGVVFQTALAPLGVAAAVADADVNHHRHPVLGDQIVQGREHLPVDSVRPDDEWRDRAGNILFGDINRYITRVGSGMAGGDDRLCRIGGI